MRKAPHEHWAHVRFRACACFRCFSVEALYRDKAGVLGREAEPSAECDDELLNLQTGKGKNAQRWFLELLVLMYTNVVLRY